ncbi:MAG: hypothetical protein LUH10_00555 [Tannerellaceae bacterium]|nr:hypothetical protein [Tannerellaceae bacterium]
MAIYKNGKKIAGSLQSISKTGTGNAITDLEVKEDGAILGATLGNTFIDVGSDQTITGAKTFSGKILASGEPNIGIPESPFGNAYINNLYASSYLYTNGKTSISDGKPGVGITVHGIYITSDHNPNISFYNNSATTSTHQIISKNNGIAVSGNFFTNNKTSDTDGRSGSCLSHTGNLTLTSAISPAINFQYRNATSTTHSIAATSATNLGFDGNIIPINTTRNIGSKISRWQALYVVNSYSRDSVFTGGKTSTTTADGTEGGVLNNDGSLALIHASTPHIDFYNGTSEISYSNRLISLTTGFHMSNTLTVGGSILSNGKTESNDGIEGCTLAANGNMALTSATRPSIQFFNSNATTITATLINDLSGLIYSGDIHSNGRTSISGVTSGVSLHQGAVTISSSTSNPYIDFKIAGIDNRRFAAYTDRLEYNGVKLATVNDITTETNLLQERIAELENELKELKTK